MKFSHQAAFVFLACFVIFHTSPVRWLADSRHALLLSESLLRHGTAALENYFPAPPSSASPREAWNDIAGVRYASGHLYYWFPPGGSLLAVPLVALFNAAGFHVIGPDGLYDADMELALQGFIASVLMAGLCAIWFSIARRLLTLRASALFVASIALATPIWSTASRVMWPDTWGLFLLSLALWMVLQQAGSKAWLFALVIAFLPVVKPTYVFSSAALAICWLVAYPKTWRALAAVFMVLVLGGVAAWGFAGFVMPPYYRLARLHVDGFWQGLAGTLFSPGRGLFVYMPVLAWVAWTLARTHKRSPLPRIAVAGLAVAALEIVAVACFPRWWGGHSFGPRLLIGILPWLFLASLHALQSCRARPIVAIALALVGVLMHGRATFSNEPARWNLEPANIDLRPSRLWDWRAPPFLAGLVPDRLYPGVPLYTTSEGAHTFLGEGWSTYGGNLPLSPESLHAAGIPASQDFARAWRWTEGSHASVRLHAVDLARRRLSLTVIPFIVPGQVDQQRVEICVGGKPLREITLDRIAISEIHVHIPGSIGRGLARLDLRMPDAISPARAGTGVDARQLGVMVLKIETE